MDLPVRAVHLITSTGTIIFGVSIVGTLHPFGEITGPQLAKAYLGLIKSLPTS